MVGAVPFPGDSHLDVVEKKRLGDFPPAGSIRPDVPAALDAILSRMMARMPRDRYQTASELIVDLERSQLSAPVAELRRSGTGAEGSVGAGLHGVLDGADAPRPGTAA